jgi:hypothetical protein
MIIIQAIKKGIYTKYQTSTLYTVDNIPFYLDHVPQSVNYPIICVYAISSNNTMAMPTTIKTEGFDYVSSRFQFSIYGNDKNHVQIEDIANRLEQLYHRQTLTLGDGVSHIETIALNQGTKFYDQSQKIWTIAIDFRIRAGL